MLPSFIAAARRRRESAEQGLSLIEGQQREVCLALDDAEAALRLAAATVDVLKAEKNDLDAKKAALLQSLQELPSLFDPRLLQRMPVELIRAVFEEAILAPDPLWPVDGNDARYNHERAFLPYLFASVCKQWRHIALETTSIWTYAGLPLLDQAAIPKLPLYKSHIDRMLKRSSSRPIDVLLYWDHRDSTSQWPHLDRFRDIVIAVARHTHRWSRVILVFPTGIDVEGVEFLRNPTPLLDEISLHSADGSSLPWLGLPNYLPQCPRLQRLNLSTIFIHPRSPLLALVEVDLVITDQPPDTLLQTLKMMPALEVLSIIFTGRSDGDPPATQLCLPRLRTLWLSGSVEQASSWATTVQLPHVEELSLPSSSCGELQGFLQPISARITKFKLGEEHLGPGFEEEDVGIADLEALDLFPDLTYVHFRRVDISLEFCERLHNVGGASAWPRLQTVTLENIEFSSDAAERFIEYVKAKVVTSKTTDAASAFSVEIVGKSRPAWLRTQLAAVLGDGLILDGISDDPVDGDSEDGDGVPGDRE